MSVKYPSPRPISLYSDEDGSSFMSTEIFDSPDATTISTGSNRSSILFTSSSTSIERAKSPYTELRTATKEASKGDNQPGHVEFMALKRQLAKFSSKTGAARGVFLRLTILPFLRKRMLENTVSSPELPLRISVFSAWWSRLLVELQYGDPSHSQATDRSAYMEAISGIISRPEWLSSTQRYADLLAETLAVIIPRLGVAMLPISLAAFAGKLLAQAFYYCDGVAKCLLYLLKALPVAVSRLVRASIPKGMNPPFSTIQGVFPSQIQDLVGCTTVPRVRPQPPTQISVLYSGWTRHWHPASALFTSFFMHYYANLAKMLPPDSESWTYAHLGGPGLFIIQGAIVTFLEETVKPVNKGFAGRRPGNVEQGTTQRRSSFDNSTSSSPAPTGFSDSVNTAAPMPNNGNAQPPPRMDKLRIFIAIREILHNNSDTIPYYRPFAIQLDKVFQTIAMSIPIHNMSSSVKLCDLAEEWILCVTLRHPYSVHQVTRSKDCAINWQFWVQVACRMISSENCYSETRAFSLLFNIWRHIPNTQTPVSETDDSCTAPQMVRKACKTLNGVPKFEDKKSDLLFALTEWLISNKIWARYFCHWNPLVRSYYHRLLCFCVASTGSNSRVFCDLRSACYINKSRAILKDRLFSTYIRCSALTLRSHSFPATTPSPVIPGRWFLVGRNLSSPTCPGMDANSVYPFDIFDNSLYYNRASQDSRIIEGPNSPQHLLSLDMPSEISVAPAAAQGVDKDKISEDPKLINKEAKGLSGLRLSLSRLKKLLPDSNESNSKSSQKSPVKRLSMLTLTGRSPRKETSPCKDGELSEETYVPGLKSSKRSSAANLRAPFSPPRPPTPPSEHIRRSQHGCDDQLAKYTKTKSLLFAKPGAIPDPWQLNIARPEITRYQYRFLLVPQDRHYVESGQIAIPFLPYEPEFEIDSVAEEAIRKYAIQPEHSGDLAQWNYGCRSLFEWNQTVAMFEEFVNGQQGHVVNIEDLDLPCMVAEIPWRMCG